MAATSILILWLRWILTSVYESHAITEQIEEVLSKRFVYDTDVHVEPAAIPEDEIYGNVLHKLSRNEKIILSKILTMKISWHLTST